MHLTKVKNRYEMLSVWTKLNMGQIPLDVLIHDYIYDSWKRSMQYGVDPFKKTNDIILDKNTLEQRIKKNQRLLDMVIPAMEDLYFTTKDSGFCIVIADNEGYILKRIGDKEELDFTGYSNFIEGANWSEQIMGTNAVGTVLALNKPIQVYGYEHYCKCACTSTCSAAPIHDTDGNIIGVLDLTGPYKLVNSHTLGMVIAATRAIERTFQLRKTYREVKKVNLQKQAIMESISEGLIAIEGDGTIVHINQHAGDLLQTNYESCLGKNIKEILPQDNTYFFDVITSGKRIYAESVVIKTSIGKKKKFLINCTPLKIEEKINNNSNDNNGAVIILYEMHNVVNKILKPKSNITFDSLIGESSNFQSVLEQAKMAADTDSNVLLLGESGVGKDLFAQAIHNASNRTNQTFIPINCAAIPRELISSELFGYDEGAFTGARRGGNPGKFELADQGTLFLDEIGEMPLDLQASLLRVLEEKSIIRLGGREYIPINVRLISATHKDLQEEIKKGNFRHDLFFRLRVISINIPALRERKGDIPILAEHFVRTFSSRFGKTINKIDPKVIDLLLNYDWPGNIRELSNVIEQTINLAHEKILTPDLLPPELLEITPTSSIPMWDKTPTKENVEEQLIRNYLIKFKNNKTEVAKALNISRSSLYRKMAKYNID